MSLPNPLLLPNTLCDYYGKGLVPKRYQDGKDGQLSFETEPLAALQILCALCGRELTDLDGHFAVHGPVPFFIRPVTNAIVGRITSLFLAPNFKAHHTFLEDQLKTSPGRGQYLCGKDLTAADVLTSFPLKASQIRSGMSQGDFPLLWAYVDRLHQREAYKRSVEKIAEGSFKNQSVNAKYRIVIIEEVNRRCGF